MSDIFKALTSDMTAAIDDAVSTAKKDIEGDLKEVFEILEGEVASILSRMQAGEPLEEILKDKDTTATLYLSGTLAKLGEKQAKAASAAHDLITSLTFIVLKSLLVKGA